MTARRADGTDEFPLDVRPAKIRIPVWLWILATLATVATSLVALGLEPETKSHAEQTYVHRDSMAMYRVEQMLQHQRDLLILDARTGLIYSELAQLLDACKHRGECR